MLIFDSLKPILDPASQLDVHIHRDDRVCLPLVGARADAGRRGDDAGLRVKVRGIRDDERVASQRGARVLDGEAGDHPAGRICRHP